MADRYNRIRYWTPLKGLSPYLLTRDRKISCVTTRHLLSSVVRTEVLKLSTQSSLDISLKWCSMKLFEFTLRRLTIVEPGCLPIRLVIFFFTIRKRPITSTLRYRLTPRAAVFLAKKNLFAKTQLAWSVLHGVDSPFRTTAINFKCSSPAMFAPSWHDCLSARFKFSR